MTTDITDRLRATRPHVTRYWAEINEAISEIERLRARVAVLEAWQVPPPAERSPIITQRRFEHAAMIMTIVASVALLIMLFRHAGVTFTDVGMWTVYLLCTILVIVAGYYVTKRFMR